MSLLERYEQQATILRRDHRVITDFDIERDLQLLAGEQVEPWKAVQRRIDESGDPTNLTGGFAGLEVNPPPLALPAVTAGTATELALWPTATWTPIAANLMAPKAYRLAAFGQQTTAATPGTVAFTPRIGTSTAGATLGATTQTAQTASETTTDWLIRGDIIIRISGGASTASAVGMFTYSQGTATTGGSIVLPAMAHIFGGTTASFDATVAQGLWMGVLSVTSTTNTFTPFGVIWASWN